MGLLCGRCSFVRISSIQICISELPMLLSSYLIFCFVSPDICFYLFHYESILNP